MSLLPDGPRGTAVAGGLAAAAALLAGLRAVWYWTTRDATRAAVDRAAHVAADARGTVLRAQDLLNWGWLAVAALLLALGVLVGVAATGRWLLFGLSALVCLPLGIAGWRLPAADGLGAVAGAFCGCVVAASAVALLSREQD